MCKLITDLQPRSLQYVSFTDDRPADYQGIHVLAHVFATESCWQSFCFIVVFEKYYLTLCCRFQCRCECQDCSNVLWDNNRMYMTWHALFATDCDLQTLHCNQHDTQHERSSLFQMWTVMRLWCTANLYQWRERVSGVGKAPPSSCLLLSWFSDQGHNSLGSLSLQMRMDWLTIWSPPIEKLSNLQVAFNAIAFGSKGLLFVRSLSCFCRTRWHGSMHARCMTDIYVSLISLTSGVDTWLSLSDSTLLFTEKIFCMSSCSSHSRGYIT